MRAKVKKEAWKNQMRARRNKRTRMTIIIIIKRLFQMIKVLASFITTELSDIKKIEHREGIMNSLV